MSGGRFSYLDQRLRDEIFGYWGEALAHNPLQDREISTLVWDILDLIHEFDWYASGDTGEEAYLAAKHKFKEKWFGASTIRIKAIIDDAVEELRKELYKTFLGGENVKD